MKAVVLDVLSNKHCEKCFLFKSEKHIDVRNKTIKINAKYVPEKIEILFVAESPPWSFVKDKHAYFYASGKMKRGGLSYHIMSVLFKERFPTKGHFLQKFMEKGLYLIDMVKCPINKLPREKKKEAIKHCAKYLNEELHLLNFKKVIFMGKSSFKTVKNYLNLDFNYAVISLPFGSDKNIQDFRRGLTKAGCNLTGYQ